MKQPGRAVPILYRLLCLFFLLPISVSAFSAGQSALWDAHSKRLELSRFVDYWQEPSEPVDIAAVANLADEVWSRNGSDSISLGYGSEVYWFRVKLENATQSKAVSLLEIGYPVLDRIELFTITLEEAAGGNDPGQGSSGEVVLRTEIRP